MANVEFVEEDEESGDMDFADDISADAEEMLTAVAERIKSHVGATEQSDDITMLGLLYKG